jgi:hypothetical protein
MKAIFTCSLLALGCGIQPALAQQRFDGECRPLPAPGYVMAPQAPDLDCVRRQQQAVDAATIREHEQSAGLFIKNLFHQWSSPNEQAMYFLGNIYPSSIIYYGKNTSRRAILIEKQKFVTRWPERTYTIRADSVTVQCDLTICHVSGIVDWDCRSAERHSRSTGTANFAFDLVGTTIVAESGSVTDGAHITAWSPEPSPPPSQVTTMVPAPQPVAKNGGSIAHWSGLGMMTTRPFHVEGPWELQWTVGETGFFSVDLHKVGGREKSIALQSEAGSSSSYVPEGGDYYLEVRATGPWSITAVSVVPDNVVPEAAPSTGVTATNPNPQARVTASNPNAPQIVGSAIPYDEQALIRASEAAMSQYATGQNDMQKGQRDLSAPKRYAV